MFSGAGRSRSPFQARLAYLFYGVHHHQPKYLKRYHLRHHYKTPEQRYRVSSPLWDLVMGTKPPDS